MSDDAIVIQCLDAERDSLHVAMIGDDIARLVARREAPEDTIVSVHLTPEDQMRLATWLLERRMGR
jgi:hypothetical protein